MNKVTYKSSRKKQYQLIAIVLIIYLAIAFSVFPQIDDHIEQGVWFFGFTLLVGVLLLFVVRKCAREICCPHCDRDLFEIIELSTHTNSDFRYCPFCGNNIEVV